MDKILRWKSYDSSGSCIYFGILVMKDLKKGFLVYEMDYKGRDANKHWTLSIGLADVTEVKGNDSDWLAPPVPYKCRDLSCSTSVRPVTADCSPVVPGIQVTIFLFSRQLTAFTKWVCIALLLCQPIHCQKLHWEGSISLKLNSTFWRALCIRATSSCAHTHVWRTCQNPGRNSQVTWTPFA